MTEIDINERIRQWRKGQVEFKHPAHMNNMWNMHVPLNTEDWRESQNVENREETDPFRDAMHAGESVMDRVEQISKEKKISHQEVVDKYLSDEEIDTYNRRNTLMREGRQGLKNWLDQVPFINKENQRNTPAHGLEEDAGFWDLPNPETLVDKNPPLPKPKLK